MHAPNIPIHKNLINNGITIPSKTEIGFVNNGVFPNSMGPLHTQTTKSNGQRVTVVIRTKNRPILLPRALASVLSQTHEDWHLYIVNDGGKRKPIDDLVSIYSSAFQGRITVIHHEYSKGMEAASNAALRVSQSDFIAIHDDDDSWHPEFLEETTQFLQSPENALYAAVVTYCTEVLEYINNDEVTLEGRRDWCGNYRFVEFSKMVQRNSFPPIALLVRRSVAHELGYFNESLPVLGDWDFNLRLMAVGDIGVIPRHLAYYHFRKPDSSASYHNCVLQTSHQHELYHKLYQNSLLRESLRNSVSHLGPLTLTLCAISELRQDVAELKQSLANLVPELRQDATEMKQSLASLVSELRRDVTEVKQSLANLVPEQRQDATEMKQSLANLVFELRQDVTEVKQSLAQVQGSLKSTSWTSEALRPIRWVWLRILALRRLIAKVCGRI